MLRNRGFSEVHQKPRLPRNLHVGLTLAHVCRANASFSDENSEFNMIRACPFSDAHFEFRNAPILRATLGVPCEWHIMRPAGGAAGFGGWAGILTSVLTVRP